MSIRCFLGLGANLGEPTAQLVQATASIAELAHVRLVATAPIYGSSPLDGIAQPDYSNTVIEIETLLAPLELLHQLQAIEAAAGRQHARERWSSRPLDIDVLSYGQLRLQTPVLTLPHPGICTRSFVVRPWADICGDFKLPDSRATMATLASTVTEPAIWQLER